jgi:hypothetical protein
MIEGKEQSGKMKVLLAHPSPSATDVKRNGQLVAVIAGMTAREPSSRPQLMDSPLM